MVGGDFDVPGEGHILVRGTKTGLPFSKGLMASSILATGLSPATAYGVAERVETALRASATREVSVDELRGVVVDVLRDAVGEGASVRYLRWQRAQERTLPLIVLIGGATGVGKSTVATQVAGRLGLTRIVSTDAVREVMRSMISEELIPALHVSSFEAVEAVSAALGGIDPLVLGFVRQVQAVGVGVGQIFERAVSEKTDTIIEGVHLVPGVVDLPDPDDAIVVQIVLTVDDPEAHRSHFSGRSHQAPVRQRERYLDHFEEIRRLHADVARRAVEHGVPTVRSYALDTTVDEVTALVVDAVTRRLETEPTGVPQEVAPGG